MGVQDERTDQPNVFAPSPLTPPFHASRACPDNGIGFAETLQ